jgi:hypothetical protein
MVVSHSFFRVPEQDRERHGFVAGGFVQLRGRLISRAEGWHRYGGGWEVFGLGAGLRLTGHGCSGCH